MRSRLRLLLLTGHRDDHQLVSECEEGTMIGRMKPAPMPAPVRDAYVGEMTAARTTADPEARWRHLERAHILSQPWPWPHNRNHVAMLALAVAQRDRREALGQVVRIVVAAPGSALGRYPRGNTGRARVGLTRPMPVPDDLADLLTREPGAGLGSVPR